MKNWTDLLFLRHLAGRYFLIKKEQQYPDYHPPIEMDESGAEFWDTLSGCAGNLSDAALQIAEKYGISEHDSCRDMEAFSQNVRAQMGLLTERDGDDR